jgi:hypothetical protein
MSDVGVSAIDVGGACSTCGGRLFYLLSDDAVAATASEFTSGTAGEGFRLAAFDAVRGKTVYVSSSGTDCYTSHLPLAAPCLAAKSETIDPPTGQYILTTCFLQHVGW